MAMNLVNTLSIQLHQQMMYQQHQMAYHHYQQEEISNPNGWPTMLSSTMAAGPQLTEDVKVELENRKLWEQFHAETTEMIITKSGRRMFPSIQLSVSGLERRSRYCILLELDLASDRRHKYTGGVDSSGNRTSAATTTGPRGWTSAGPAEPQPSLERRLYIHPDSPATGAHWMQHPLSFSKLKLTNNVVEQHSNVLLTSMHKYVPRILIVRCDEITNLQDLYKNPSSVFTFKETEFIAVTAYQNENITKLKIDNNPFAKGFRTEGQSSCKRKRLPRDGCNSSSTSEISSHDEEDGNASLSDSDHNESSDSPLVKRARLHHDERSSVGNYENEPTPLAQRLQEVPVVPEPRRETQPRLHRPWADDSEETTLNNNRLTVESLPLPQSLPVTAQVPLRMSAQYANYMGVQPVHYHAIMALEMAKMRERYVAQHFPLLMDYRRTI
ncbi:hypothetical protein TSAR_010074 [Trichomalopsis sarcophagae]|uniref:T-box domain-containing protein n=1 Tax=Trichomalopsis sarcophagae TaxID=543379 RepID=A0A232F7S1_9HYME|nr:hypothetical protein TSAR_010074 [Trichomalopsis sarcophagae]